MARQPVCRLFCLSGTMRKGCFTGNTALFRAHGRLFASLWRPIDSAIWPFVSRKRPVYGSQVPCLRVLNGRFVVRNPAVCCFHTMERIMPAVWFCRVKVMAGLRKGRACALRGTVLRNAKSVIKEWKNYGKKICQCGELVLPLQRFPKKPAFPFAKRLHSIL